MPWIITLLLCCSLLRLDAKEVGDHLVPADEHFDLKDYVKAAYWKLIQQKLLVTPGDVARFVQFPGAYGAETALSIYRADGKDRVYWITITQPSSSLWERVVPDPGENQPKNRGGPVTVERCDAPLPDSTAVAIRRVWLEMLMQTRPEAKPEFVSVDSTIQIFMARARTGKILRGQTPPYPAPKTGNLVALMNLVNFLIHYCDSPESTRAENARQIEKDASALLMRLQQH